MPSQAPGSNQGYSYSYDDREVQPGQTYWYWLQAVDLAGATALHGPVSVTVTEPTAVTLDDFAASDQPSARHALWIPAAGLGLVALAMLIARRRRIVVR